MIKIGSHAGLPLIAAAVWVITGPQAAEAVVIHHPNFSISLIARLPDSFYSPSDIELDAVGNLYIPTQTDGVVRVSPAGSISPWSTAPAVDLTLLPSGDGYGAGRSLCNCIVAFSADGLYSILHADSLSWDYVKLAPDGTLYATIWAGSGRGLYTIDRVTGTPTVVVKGGPGPGGSGAYRDMAFGLDGRLHVLGDGDNGGETALFRLDGTQFTQLATLPAGGIGLARDSRGIFYVTTSTDTLGEVWIVNATSGSASLLASDLSSPYAIAYDTASDRLYVAEQSRARILYAITGAATPATPVSWGALKVRYR